MRVQRVLCFDGAVPLGVLLSVTEDELSIWLSSFREAIESVGRKKGSLRGHLGAPYEDIKSAMGFILNLLGENKVPPGAAMGLNGFALDRREDLLVRSKLKRVERNLRKDDRGGTLALVTTLQTLEVTAACATEMRAYLWPEEVHIITGYEQNDIDSFLASVEKCVDELREISG